MSKQWALLLWDDLDAQSGIQTQADTTLICTIGGQDIELDLTTRHYDDFMEFVQPYIDASTKARTPAVDSHGSGKGKTFRRSPERMQWLSDLRDWADTQGRQSEYQGKTDPKLYSYKRALVRDYEAYLASKAGKAA